MASIGGRSRMIAKTRGPQLPDGAGGRPAVDAERDERAAVGGRRDHPHARDRGEALVRECGQARGPVQRPVEADVHRQPADAAREPDHRRPVEAGRLEPAGAVAERAALVPVEGRVARGSRPSPGSSRPRTRGGPRARPCPPGPAATSGRARRRRRRPARRAPRGSRRPTARRRSATRRRPRGRASRARRPGAPRRSSRARGSRPRPGPGARARAGRRRASSSASPPSPMSTNSTSTPWRSRRAWSGPRTPGCSWFVVTTRSPGAHGSDDRTRLIPSVVECVKRDVVRIRDQERGDRGARLRHPVHERDELVDLRATDGQLAGGLLVHRPHGLGGQRAARARVQVDAGTGRRQQLPDRRDLLRVGHEGGYHARIISADLPSPAAWRPRGRLRPSRADCDTRVAGRQHRPAGCPGGGRALASGRHRRPAARRGPRARGRPPRLADVRRADDRTMRTCCSSPPPERLADTMAAAGVADGMTVVLYDDTLSYHAARAWWSLRAYGFDTARILDGGYQAWIDGSHPVATGDEGAPPSRFTPRLQPRRHVTTADVRGLLGAPDVLLVDARGPAEYHGFEGNVRRLGHIPGAVNLPVAATHLPGSQTAAGPGRAPLAAAQGQHHPRPSPRLLRPVRRGGGQARVGAVAPRPRGRRRVRRRVGGLGRPDGPAGQPVATPDVSRAHHGRRPRNDAEGPDELRPSQGSTSRWWARICVRWWLTATSSAVRRASPRRSDQ